MYFTYTPMLPNLWVEPVKWANQYAQYGRNFFDPVTGAISTEAKYLNGKAHAWIPESRSSEKVYLCEYVENKDTTITEQVYVWDKFGLNEQCDDGNYDFANVQLNLNHCGTALLSGTVRLGSELMEGMSVKASDGEQEFRKITEADGRYAFSVPQGQYTIKSESDEDYLKGISTLDILIIQKYILGLKQITDPLLLIAADANKNSMVTAADILEVRKTLLGTKDRFENNSWVGIATGYQFVNPERSFEEVEQARRINVEVHNNETVSGLDFKAVKIGDMNNSNKFIEGRSTQSLMFMLDDISAGKEQQSEIPVYARDFSGIQGFQLTLRLGGLQLKVIRSGTLEIAQSNYNVKRDDLLMSWNTSEAMTIEDGAVLFTLVIEAREEVLISSELMITDDKLRSESYRGEDLEIMNVRIGYRNNEFVLHQNQPNPFSKETLIGFELPKEEEYILRIYDVNGQEIYLTRSKGKAGYNAVAIGKEVINTSGVYYYRLESGENTATRKMIYYK